MGGRLSWVKDVYRSHFLPFDTVAPWRENGRYAEESLRDLDQISRAGQSIQGRSVRHISERDFNEIVAKGFSETLDPSNAQRLGLDYDALKIVEGVSADVLLDPGGRRIEQLLVNRKVRDAAFRENVCAAYEDTCAVTRLRIINGGGRAEVQAAHIMPVASGGPDIVQNGLALSATAHWLFDRHLISISDDYGLLVSHNKVPSEYAVLFRTQTEKIHLPKDERLWPSREFLKRHREIYAGH